MALYAPQKLTIDLTGRKGLSDKYYGDINKFGFTNDLSLGQPQYRYTGIDGEMVSGIFNPIRKLGYLSPSVGTIYGITSGQTDSLLIAGTRYDSINDKVYQMTGITGTANPAPLFRYDGIDSESPQSDRTMPSGTVGGFIEIYLMNGVRTLFYSYVATGGWRVGTKILDGGSAGTFSDNWLGTAGAVTNAFQPTSTGELKFIVSGDGFMYIMQANHLHRVDGTAVGGSTGTIYKDVLLAPEHFRFSHGVDHRSNLYLAIQKTTNYEVHNGTVKEGLNFVSDCGIYIWNRQSTFFNTSDYIPIQGVREIRALWVSPKNTIRCITVAANGVVQIREYNGTYFKIIKELGACAFPNYPDSLVVVNGFTIWLGYDGNIYYYGSELPEEKEFLFIMGSVGGTGMQNVLGGTILYAGSSGYATGGSGEKPHPEAIHLNYTISSTAKTAKFFPESNGSVTGGVTTAMNSNTTPIYTPMKYLPRLSNLKAVTIFMARETGLSAAVSDATVKIYINGNTTAFMSKTITTDDIMKGFRVIEVNAPFVDSIQLSITYLDLAMSNFRFSPNFAVVEYVPTDSSK